MAAGVSVVAARCCHRLAAPRARRRHNGFSKGGHFIGVRAPSLLHGWVSATCKINIIIKIMGCACVPIWFAHTTQPVGMRSDRWRFWGGWARTCSLLNDGIVSADLSPTCWRHKHGLCNDAPMFTLCCLHIASHSLCRPNPLLLCRAAHWQLRWSGHRQTSSCKRCTLVQAFTAAVGLAVWN